MLCGMIVSMLVVVVTRVLRIYYILRVLGIHYHTLLFFWRCLVFFDHAICTVLRLYSTQQWW